MSLHKTSFETLFDLTNGVVTPKYTVQLGSLIMNRGEPAGKNGIVSGHDFNEYKAGKYFMAEQSPGGPVIIRKFFGKTLLSRHLMPLDIM